MGPEDTHGRFSWNVWGQTTLQPQDLLDLSPGSQEHQIFNASPTIFCVLMSHLAELTGLMNPLRPSLLMPNLRQKLQKKITLKALSSTLNNTKVNFFTIIHNGIGKNVVSLHIKNQVRQRGREFMHAINKEYPQITILLTYGYYVAHYKKKFAWKSSVWTPARIFRWHARCCHDEYNYL